MLDDIEAACNMIKHQRDANKKNKNKNITVKLFKENNRSVSTILNIITRNDNPSYGHCIKYYKKCIYPTTNNKLKCINKAGLLQLKKHRKAVKERYVKQDNIRFYKTLNNKPYLGLVESVRYNKKTGDVYCMNAFKCNKNLLRIDIE